MTKQSEITRARQHGMLRTAMGPEITTALADGDVIEVMVNPDGHLWLDRQGPGQRQGRCDTGVILPAAQAERIIRLVASHIDQDCHAGAPVVSAELPGTGERFEGLLPPVAMSPCFVIRKPAALRYGLQDYVTAGIMTVAQAGLLKEAVLARRNIVVVGGTSSGKTTLVNALLCEVAKGGDRVILIEDTRELQCAARDCVALRTGSGVTTLCDLVRSTLRLRPDRIIIGEVRGPEALDLLKAWNTGHPGGITTLHANSAPAGLTRLEQLVQEAVITVPKALIAEAVDMVVSLQGRGAARRLDQILAVTGISPDGRYDLTDPISNPMPKS